MCNMKTKEDKTAKLIETYYCKSLKDTGEPLVSTYYWRDGTKDIVNGHKSLHVKGENIDRIEIVYNNATGKAKRSGASTVLKVYLK